MTTMSYSEKVKCEQLKLALKGTNYFMVSKDLGNEFCFLLYRFDIKRNERVLKRANLDRFITASAKVLGMNRKTFRTFRENAVMNIGSDPATKPPSRYWWQDS